jgi:hypothetical protein
MSTTKTKTKSNSKSTAKAKDTQPQPQGFVRPQFTTKYETGSDATTGVIVKWASDNGLLKGHRESTPSTSTTNSTGKPRMVSRLVYLPSKSKVKVYPSKKGRVKFSQSEFASHYGLPQASASKVLTFLVARGVVKKLPREQWAGSKSRVAIYQQIADLTGSTFDPS